MAVPKRRMSRANTHARRSPWGKPEGRTRKPNRPSDKLIMRRRRSNKNKKR